MLKQLIRKLEPEPTTKQNNILASLEESDDSI